jgi:glycosyltransferase involved in cell wall biosynthesis
VRFVFSLLALRPGRIGGTESYLRELLAAMPERLDGDEVVVLAGRDAAASVETPGLGRAVLDLSPTALVARRAAEAFTPWRDRFLEGTIATLRPDAVFFPQFSMYPIGVGAPAVVHVADVQHLLLPDNFALLDRAFRRAIYPRSLARARLVVAASSWTASTLVRLADVDESKIRVVRHGTASRAITTTTAAAPVEGPYLYYPAVTNPHKGHDVLIESFAVLVREGLGHRLVLTGQKTGHWKTLERRIRALGLERRVLHLGYVDREVVEALYAYAEAVVFPSRFEGFGLPVVEAAGHGVRVITSDLEVFGENGIEGLLRIDFADAGQLRAALASPVRARVVDGAWTWSDAASATLDALREAARMSRES